tara:strand:- start:18404 stop:25429 length:7026 start_codon:yes stop_codon:yes gene_type:complete
MVRSVTKKYQVWLAGYYDDFNGARAIGDFTAKPSDTTTYTHLSSHFGNPLNGEAFLNPRYRWSAEEREQDSNAGNKVSTTANNMLQNDGIFEWLTFDDTRLGDASWTGRVQLQYPDGHVANRYKFNNDSTYGSDFYQRFINGHNSDGSYIVPTGENDASFGRSDMKRYDATNYQAKNAGKTSTTGNFVQRAHLTGSWMGEKLAQTSSNEPSLLFAEITSPSKQPFLCVQTVRENIDDDFADVPAIIYDGPLNSRLDGDIFTARIAVRSHIAEGVGVWDDIKVKFEIGFPTAQAGILNDEGYTGVAAITQSLDLKTFTDSTGTVAYDNQGLITSGNSWSYTNDNSWLDVDFVFDYTNTKYDWYVNGVKQNNTPEDMNAGTTAAGIYGYQLSIESDETDGDFGYVSYLMLDRVGLVRYLSDDFTSSNEPQISKLEVKQSNNGLSTCVVNIFDDAGLTGGARGNVASDYLLNLRGLFVSSTPIDWNLLVFGDTDKRIDRPIWRGLVDTFNINQKGRSREIILKAVDSLDALNNQVPLWDVGQQGESETGEDSNYWDYDSQGFRDAMYLGTGKLKLLSNDVGFESTNSYLESSTQRTQLGSGHPIQMYNNEDSTNGPNDIEDSYEGLAILGFVEKRHATDHKTIAILAEGSHTLGAGDTISITNTSNHNDASLQIESESNNELTFTGNGTSTGAATYLAYVPETAKIVYAGQQPHNSAAESYLDDDGNTVDNPIPLISWTQFTNNVFTTATTTTGPYIFHFFFDANPNLKIGDYFYMNRRNMAHAVPSVTYFHHELRHKVVSVKKFRNYFDTSGATPVLYSVETETPCVSQFGNSQAVDGLLDGTARYEWSKDTGQTNGHYTTAINATKTKNRSVHARWMRDLPKSLWFQYHFGVVQEAAANTSQDLSNQTITSSTKVIQIPQATYNSIPTHGVAEIWSVPSVGAEVYQEKFIYQGKVQVSSNYYMVGCKYINNSYSVSSNNFKVKVQTISDNYKHIWLLWSDMRNNGNANADASTRKKNFGLQYPLHDNYDFDLFYVDQVDQEGNIDKFASLKVGDDLRVWNLDSTSDPCTGGAFSKPADYANSESCTIALNSTNTLRVTDNSHGLSNDDYVYIYNSLAHDGLYQIENVGTNTFDIAQGWTTGGTADGGNTGGVFYAPITGSHKDLSTYQNWEDKAGSFLVIDSAPFFNLNTHANGGKTGQIAGGSTDLGDYVATRHGFPKLIDNYWEQATATYQNTDNDLLEHPNQDKLISDAQLSPDGFIFGDVGITVEDARKFDDSGYGILNTVMNRNGNEEDNTMFYFTWKNKLESKYSSGSGATAVALVPSNSSSGTTLTGFWEGTRAIKLVNSSGSSPAESHYSSGVRAGMTLIRTPNGGGTKTRHTILRVGDEANEGNIHGANQENTLIVSKSTVKTTYDGSGNLVSGNDVSWSIGDTYEIPIQLGKVKVINSGAITLFPNMTINEKEQAINDQMNITPEEWFYYGFPVSYTTDTTKETTPEHFEVHATVQSSYMLRLMMHMNGFYESTNSGTFWNHDKLRFLWNASIMDSWLPSAKVSCVFDINNVPITSMMTTYNDTSSNDSYGSVLDSRGKTLGSIVKDLTKKTGHGTTNSLPTTFSYLIGRDNRIEIRPKYNSGISFNRNNMLISRLDAQVSGQITNVRVYYNDNQSFVDYPATNLTDTTRWKIVEHPKILNSKEALIVARKQYNTYNNNSLRMEVSPMLDTDVEDKMIHTGRYGYISDPYIALQGTDDTEANVTNWTYLGTGGVLFPGMVNALHGNMSTDVDPIEDRYGISQETGSGDITWNNNYYWYGSNSISNAVQIVHIPNDTPFVGSTTGHPLRIWVDLKNQTGTNIDEAEFTVHIADYRFDTNLTHALQSSQLSNNTSSKDVKHSGYYEIDIPASYYSSQGKIIFSFNAEYCRALLRHRCGDPSKTNSSVGNSTHSVDANYYILDSSVDNGSGAINKNSIFPLGMRPYTEMGGGFRNQRKEWYAPRIQICRDLSYVPASYVGVTDLGLEMNNETMVIQSVQWGASAKGIDTVKLTLERDESLSSDRLLSFLLSGDNDGLQSGNNGGSSSTTPHWDAGWGIGLVPPSQYPNADHDPSSETEYDGYEDTGDGTSFGGGITVGKMSKNTYGNIKGRMNLNNDNLSGDAQFSVLGQQKPSVTPSSMRGIEGMDVDITPISGTAVKTADGYIFAGKGLQGGDYKVASQEVSLETTFVVPEDVLSNRISIEAKATHAPTSIAGNKTALLYVTVTNQDNNASVTHTARIGAGKNNETLSILPEVPLSGLNKAGRKIKVTITRKPATSDDDSDASSVVLKNISVKMQRASAHTKSSSNNFSASTG